MKYLNALGGAGFVRKVKAGRLNYHINTALGAIPIRAQMVEGARG